MTVDAKNNRKLFEGFLRRKLSPGGDPYKYSRSLDNKIKRFYNEKLGRKCESIYELTDENAVYGIKQDIATHPSMVYRPGRSVDSRIEGLNWYIEYLNSPRTQIDISGEPQTIPNRVRIRIATPEMEGKHIKKEMTVIQRNPEARKKCIEYFGCKCMACGLIMSEKYGEIGEGFIEVHHLNPIHLFDDSHQVDYRTDLIPLCPNCHSMIHRLEDPGDLEGLKQIIQQSSGVVR